MDRKTTTQFCVPKLNFCLRGIDNSDANDEILNFISVPLDALEIFGQMIRRSTHLVPRELFEQLHGFLVLLPLRDLPRAFVPLGSPDVGDVVVAFQQQRLQDVVLVRRSQLQYVVVDDLSDLLTVVDAVDDDVVPGAAALGVAGGDARSPVQQSLNYGRFAFGTLLLDGSVQHGA